MAALSFSPSPPPAPTTAAATTTTPQRNNSKENTHLQHVNTLGANKPFQKMTVHNVLSESGANALQQHISNQNTIIRKIKDFGMLGAVQNAAATTTAAAATTATTLPRKRPLGEQQAKNKPLAVSSQTKRSKVSKKQQAEKLTLREQEKLELSKRPVTGTPSTLLGLPGRKGLPLPQAVARRNARERNRVKQVNNGFAALRERIPDEVSVAFEAQGAGRGASKKLSKVETLRMAVEYIRSLEKLLGYDFPAMGCSNSNSSSSGDDSFMFIKDEFDALDDQFDDELETSQQQQVEQQQQQQQQLEQDMLMLPCVTTLNGLQYVRIPGTSTYQLLTPDMLGTQEQSSSLDEEQFNALIDAATVTATAAAAVNSNSTLSRSPVPTSTTTSRCSTPTTARRSSSSLQQPPNDGAVAVAVSPVANELLLQACAAQQQQQQQQLIKQEYSEAEFRLVTNSSNNNSSTSPPAIHNYQQQQQQPLLCSPVLPAFYDQEPSASFYDNVVVGLPSFKKEFTDVLQDQSNNTAGGCLSDESMIDAIDWWEAHTPKSDAGTVAGL